ncbi:MAG: hypothetical protein ACRDL5_02130, partial [Solirubrobacteraceae bacterium]
MSDSLKATVIVSSCVLAISTRPDELEDEAADELLPVAPDPESPESELAPEPDPVLEPDPFADTASPELTSATETTVPEAGANSRVCDSAFWASRSVASAPSTAACADATPAASESADWAVPPFAPEVPLVPDVPLVAAEPAREAPEVPELPDAPERSEAPERAVPPAPVEPVAPLRPGFPGPLVV